MLALCSMTAQALMIRNYTADRHDRFSSGYPANPQPNTNFWLAAHDLSGVGWDASNANRSVTLVTPRHFIAANHVRPALGATLVFLNRNDVLQSNTVSAYHTMTNNAGEVVDVILGELSDSSLADNDVSYYAVAAFDSEAEYEGLPLVMYGKTARAGAGTIDAFTDLNVSGINTTRAFEINYNNLSGDDDDAHAESDDSGSPSFLLVSNRLALVGTHAAVRQLPNSVTTVDGFIPHYLDQLNAAARKSAHQLALAPTPKAPPSYITGIAREGTNIVLDWTATNFFNYTLLFTTNELTSAISWREVSPASRPGPQEEPYSMSGTNEPSSLLPMRVYRVRIETPQATGH